MSQEHKELSEAKMLAAMLIGGIDMSMGAASVQRSHRFPLRIFNQMENMAKIANVSFSVIINQMLEAGLEKGSFRGYQGRAPDVDRVFSY